MKQCWTTFYRVAKWVQQRKTCFVKHHFWDWNSGLGSAKDTCVNPTMSYRLSKHIVHQTQEQKKCFTMWSSKVCIIFHSHWVKKASIIFNLKSLHSQFDIFALSISCFCTVWDKLTWFQSIRMQKLLYATKKNVCKFLFVSIQMADNAQMCQ